MDFLGAGVTANARESNSYNLRIRQAWLTYDNDYYHFHLMAGQGWSLLTQDRVGQIATFTGVRLTVRSVLERADLAGACHRKWVVSI